MLPPPYRVLLVPHPSDLKLPVHLTLLPVPTTVPSVALVVSQMFRFPGQLPINKNVRLRAQPNLVRVGPTGPRSGPVPPVRLPTRNARPTSSSRNPSKRSSRTLRRRRVPRGNKQLSAIKSNIRMHSGSRPEQTRSYTINLGPVSSSSKTSGDVILGSWMLSPASLVPASSGSVSTPLTIAASLYSKFRLNSISFRLRSWAPPQVTSYQFSLVFLPETSEMPRQLDISSLRTIRTHVQAMPGANSTLSISPRDLLSTASGWFLCDLDRSNPGLCAPGLVVLVLHGLPSNLFAPTVPYSAPLASVEVTTSVSFAGYKPEPQDASIPSTLTPAATVTVDTTAEGLATFSEPASLTMLKRYNSANPSNGKTGSAIAKIIVNAVDAIGSVCPPPLSWLIQGGCFFARLFIPAGGANAATSSVIYASLQDALDDAPVYSSSKSFSSGPRIANPSSVLVNYGTRTSSASAGFSPSTYSDQCCTQDVVAQPYDIFPEDFFSFQITAAAPISTIAAYPGDFQAFTSDTRWKAYKVVTANYSHFQSGTVFNLFDLSTHVFSWRGTPAPRVVLPQFESAGLVGFAYWGAINYRASSTSTDPSYLRSYVGFFSFTLQSTDVFLFIPFDASPMPASSQFTFHPYRLVTPNTPTNPPPLSAYNPRDDLLDPAFQSSSKIQTQLASLPTSEPFRGPPPGFASDLLDLSVQFQEFDLSDLSEESDEDSAVYSSDPECGYDEPDLVFPEALLISSTRL
uniref:Pro-secreted protein ORF2 n=1 Tax=Newt hepevirus TaxID=2969588 RepID=A0A9N6YJN0_9VIRU|nr:TPA_asm: capsid [Newt hepevirus]